MYQKKTHTKLVFQYNTRTKLILLIKSRSDLSFVDDRPIVGYTLLKRKIELFRESHPIRYGLLMRTVPRKRICFNAMLARFSDTYIRAEISRRFISPDV